MTKLPAIIIALLALVWAGCASTDTTPEYSSSDDCFDIRQIRNWSVIDDDHVYLEELGNDNYLLTLFSSCSGLKFTQAIALSNNMGRMCPNDFGRITYRDGGMRSSCRIDNIERVATKDDAISLVDARNEDTKD